MRNIFIILALLVTTLSASNELQRAYAKEFAFLKAQKKVLSSRLLKLKQKQDNDLKDARLEIENLQNLVIKKNAQSEVLSNKLYQAQQNSQNISDDTSLIEAVSLQANSTLSTYGKDVKIDKLNYKDTLATMFDKSIDLIDELATLRKKDGEFYLEDGSQINGVIIYVGNIATYGVSSKASGALVPAGAGKLKLYKTLNGSTTAQALYKNQNPDILNIFLYENSSKEIDDVAQKTVLSVINSGGIIGWVIVILGVVGLILAFARSIFLIGSSSENSTLAPEALQELLAGGSERALKFLKDKKGATARVLKATIRNLDRDREHIEDIVAESILHESTRLDRFSSAIMVIAAVSPLLGLLGTVTGMIATFDIITEFGTGDPKLLSGGISIALVTTELGLVVAIPILMIGNLLGGWAEKVKDSMEHSALHLINEYNKTK